MRKTIFETRTDIAINNVTQTVKAGLSFRETDMKQTSSKYLDITLINLLGCVTLFSHSTAFPPARLLSIGPNVHTISTQW